MARMRVAPGLSEKAKAIGLYGQRLDEFILHMAEESAPFTHEEGNRRYYSYLLDIQGGVVVGIKRLDRDTPMVRAEAQKDKVSREIVQKAIARHFPNQKR